MSPQTPPPPDKMRFQLTLRQRGISDQAVLKAMEDVPRELFVSAADRAQAYSDTALGISCGQTISQPFVVAYMTEQLQLRRDHRVLEIGTGSGYQAAVASKLCREVVTLERYRMLATRAQLVLAETGCDNVEVVVADGFNVPDTLGTFDRIIVTAAMADVPQALLSRLMPEGVLIAPVGPPDGIQQLMRFARGGGRTNSQQLLPVRFVPMLPGIAKEL